MRIEKKREWNRAWVQKTRLQALEKLGNCCARCGFSDVRALQIDGGDSQQKRIGAVAIYIRIVKGFVDDYQCLCANCSCIIRFARNEHRERIYLQDDAIADLHRKERSRKCSIP